MSDPKPSVPSSIDPSSGLPLRSRGEAPSDEHRGRAQAIAFARSLAGDKCKDVLVLDLRGRSQVTDFFVIGSGTSDRQMVSAGQHLIDQARALGDTPYRTNVDEPRANWIVIDFVDVVAHIMMPEARAYYDLEMLWGDAPRLEWNDDPEPKKPETATRNRAGLTASDILPSRPRPERES